LLIDWPTGAREAKALVGYLDLLVTGRIHLGVAALGSGILAAIAAYQGKVEGLLRHFALPELVIDREVYLSPGRLAARVEVTISRLAELTEGVRRNLPRLRVLALQNFAYVSTESTDRGE
jgi:polysaccharide pyruvyl transferase WcaK-like protein